MMNLRSPNLPRWPIELAPVGDGTFEKESFAVWWARHNDRLSHLDPLIAEQWIHRHWYHSHFAFLPLDELRWSRESWQASKIISDVVRYGLGNEYHPAFDYKAFAARPGRPALATAAALDRGTWDYPIVVLSTPSGFRDIPDDRPDARFVLIEGHQRMRYLNALLMHKCIDTGPHDVFVLTWQYPEAITS
jgi:hypothetical protein